VPRAEVSQLQRGVRLHDGARTARAALDHHPDWRNVYDRVWIELWTHDASGLTQLDFELAARANALFARFAK
jgi:pterin-4a-carbinolamine dehydratase